MSHRSVASSAALALAVLLGAPSSARAVQEPPARDVFADRVSELVLVVGNEHISPPSTGELLGAGIERLAEVVHDDLASWKKRVPASDDPEETRAFLKRLHDDAARDEDPVRIVNAMVAGISRRIPGGASTIDPATARVNDSLAGNRYVGVGVVLDFTDGRPKILDTYFGGPAHRAGIRPGDVIYEVDGFDTAGMPLARFIDYSRDELGTVLEYVVGAPGSDERRTTLLTRSVVPTETVLGTVRAADERWDFAVPSTRTAHVKLVGITASTPHELRVAARRIERAALEGVVLDLRGCRSTHMHATALVADLFSSGGVMGASATRRDRTEYRAAPDACFDPGSVVVLVDGRTRGTAEWLAAVLRRGGATVVGEATAGVPFLRSRVVVPGWPVEVNMATGWILDPDGPEGERDDRAMGRIEPDRTVEAERALDAARAHFEREVSDR